MATRSAQIPAGQATDLTAALQLERGLSYLVEVTSTSTDSILIAQGGDPETVGGHLVAAGEPSRLIRQGSEVWFARFYNLQGRSATLTATEASCA